MGSGSTSGTMGTSGATTGAGTASDMGVMQAGERG
jgi:hypothetical protein